MNFELPGSINFCYSLLLFGHQTAIPVVAFVGEGGLGRAGQWITRPC